MKIQEQFDYSYDEMASTNIIKQFNKNLRELSEEAAYMGLYNLIHSFGEDSRLAILGTIASFNSLVEKE